MERVLKDLANEASIPKFYTIKKACLDALGKKQKHFLVYLSHIVKKIESLWIESVKCQNVFFYYS